MNMYGKENDCLLLFPWEKKKGGNSLCFVCIFNRRDHQKLIASTLLTKNVDVE